MAWYLNPFLTAWRNAVNARYPNRDKGSDGTIGDEAHQATSSDHNPDPPGEPDAGSVDAWDCDRELNGLGQPSEADCYYIISVFETLPGARYWIFKGQIARKRDNWRRDPYTGSNPHNEHIHFNSDEAGENNGQPIVLGGTLTYPETAKTADMQITWEIRPWLATTHGAVLEMQRQQDTDTTRLQTLVAEVSELEADSDESKAKAAQAAELAQSIANQLTAQTQLITQMATVIEALSIEHAPVNVTEEMLTKALKTVLREGTAPSA